MQIKNTYKIIFTSKKVGGVDLIHQNDKISVQSSLQMRIMGWFHNILLVHSGKDQMEARIYSL